MPFHQKFFRWGWLILVIMAGALTWITLFGSLINADAPFTPTIQTNPPVLNLLIALGFSVLAHFYYSQRHQMGLRGYGAALYFASIAMGYGLLALGSTYWLDRLLEFLMGVSITMYAIGYWRYIQATTST